MSVAMMSVLSKGEIEQVHSISLRMLSEVGVKVDSPSVLDMMAKAGARVENDKGIVFLDERMVSQALKTAPKKVKICSRGGRDFSVPEADVQLISTDGQPPAVFDIETMSKRPSKLKDVVDFAVLSDALPEVDYIWPPVVATDMPAGISSRFEFLATIGHSSKHVQHGAASADEANFQVEVASAIAGSPEELRRRPLFSDVCTPISPLRYDQGEAEALVVLARAGIPVVHLSMGIAGSVTPVTIAGTLAVVNAENLCGLTLSQVASTSAPVFYSSFSGVTDLRSGVFLCGTPEGVLMDACAVEMARHYHLPTCAGGPSNAARILSAEAGYQTMMTAMGAILSGADLVVGLGGLDRAGMMSLEKLVMDCEMWRWLERLRKGVEITTDTIGFEAIKRQGPGGVFLSDPHTLKHMRKDMMIPQVTGYHAPRGPDRRLDELIEHAKRRTSEILSRHVPQLLPIEVAEKVAAISAKYGVMLPGGRRFFERA